MLMNQRVPVSNFIYRLMNYDVISFDIFDTLILRSINDPKDLFSFLSPKYRLLDFEKVRIKAEATVRLNKKEKTGSREVSIYDIYEEVNRFTSIDIQEGIKNEFDLEKKLCYANPYMKRVFDTLIKNGKRVIIISDMYLPYDMTAELLKSCGYSGYEALFVSCDYDCSKSNKELFKVVEKKLKKYQSIIHIGDNLISDFLNPLEIGWHAEHYERTFATKTASKYKDLEMSKIIGSFYKAININYFENGLLDEPPYNNQFYWYGFNYGGLMILGYILWIHKKALEEGVDKIIFLARDGDIMKKVYDQHFHDIPSAYALWSRHAAIKTSLKININDYMKQFITRRRKEGKNISVKNILEDMELGMLVKNLPDVGLTEKSKIKDRNAEKLLFKLIIENSETVKKLSSSYSEAAKMYYKDLVGDAKSVFIVDIGWRGSGGMILKYLFENEWHFDCKIKTIVGGGAADRDIDMFYLTKDIECYMFSQIDNQDLLEFHGSRLAINYTIVEIFTSSTDPAFLSFKLNKDGGYDMLFDPVEIENRETLELIQKGIFDFTKEYMLRAKGIPELLNISGRDAYQTMVYLMTGERFTKFRKDFKNYKFSGMIAGLREDGDNLYETFEDMYRVYLRRKQK